jgi:hypothetical protein
MPAPAEIVQLVELFQRNYDQYGAAKAPDYAFRIGKERKFFVEAKKPAVNIQYDIEPAYQLRRYAWNAKLPLSILTDFEEFSVYDCRSKPAAADKASAGRILLVNYRDYVARWDGIAAVFAKAAVWQGALDKFADPTDGARHERMVALVTQTATGVDLHNRLAARASRTRRRRCNGGSR